MEEVCSFSLLESHRKLQWILKHIMWLAPTGSERKKDAAFELCRVRDLCSCLDRVSINEQDAVTGETALISLCANGGNIDDIELLVASGAELNSRSSSGKLAVDMASENGHDRCAGTRCKVSLALLVRRALHDFSNISCKQDRAHAALLAAQHGVGSQSAEAYRSGVLVSALFLLMFV